MAVGEELARAFFTELGSVLGATLFIAIGVMIIVAMLVGAAAGVYLDLSVDDSLILVAAGALVTYFATGSVVIVGFAIAAAGVANVIAKRVR